MISIFFSKRLHRIISVSQVSQHMYIRFALLRGEMYELRGMPVRSVFRIGYTSVCACSKM